MNDMTPYRGGLPGYRPNAPETSREAALDVADAAKSREASALVLIRAKGLYGATADEVADALDWERYSSRPRLSTLKKAGKIVDSGDRRKGTSGRAQAVWIASELVARPDGDQGELFGRRDA